VTLRRPVPLGRPLEVDRPGPGAAVVKDEKTLIAEARTAALEIIVPPPVTLEEAERAREGYRSAQEIFSTCFVCGPDREDSQRVFAGPVAGRDIAATPWTPRGDWISEDGFVRPEFVWAVLDCPTYFALEIDRPGLTAMLGRMTARLFGAVPAGETQVVMAWSIGSERRKHEAGCAVFSEAGELRAAAKAIQIQVGEMPASAAG